MIQYTLLRSLLLSILLMGGTLVTRLFLYKTQDKRIPDVDFTIRIPKSNEYLNELNICCSLNNYVSGRCSYQKMVPDI